MASLKLSPGPRSERSRSTTALSSQIKFSPCATTVTQLTESKSFRSAAPLRSCLTEVLKKFSGLCREGTRVMIATQNAKSTLGAGLVTVEALLAFFVGTLLVLFAVGWLFS
jgi:hypothetical protein